MTALKLVITARAYLRPVMWGKTDSKLLKTRNSCPVNSSSHLALHLGQPLTAARLVPTCGSPAEPLPSPQAPSLTPSPFPRPKPLPSPQIPSLTLVVAWESWNKSLAMG